MTSLNSAAKTNLPVEPNAFVGRERDAADIRRLLANMRAVTLCGAGGIGKTRLALHVARSVSGDYPDGVWFAELAGAPRDGPPEPVARRVAAVLGVAEDAAPGGAAAAVAHVLRSRVTLLVLDNCEHLIGDCAELTRALLARCPGLRILATSREPLRMAGENVWRVPPLEPDEATRLFVERARAIRPGFACTGAVAEVGRALDGVPLALELAAARIRALSAEQIARRLAGLNPGGPPPQGEADRFRLLNAGDRTAPPRQRTLRAAIDWSHDLLGDDERTLLRRLAVFAGWTLEQAEHVCADGALPAGDVLDLLTALVDKSLAVVCGEEAGEVRFRQLDSIRQYAAERLTAAGERDEFHGRHRDAVLEAAERHGAMAVAERPASWRERVELFHRYDHELGNVLAALGWSLDRGDIEEGLRICTALRTYWIVRGRTGEWEEWTDRFLARAADLPAHALGPALAGRAQLALGGRDFAGAAEFAERALPPCREAGDDCMTAAALVTLAESHTRAGRLADAAGRLDEADAIAAAPGLEWHRAYALTARGYLSARRANLDEARAHFEAGLRIMLDIGQLWGASHALIGLGRLAELRGDPTAARPHYDRALPRLEEIGARPEMARALAGIGRVALDQGDAPAARGALARSLGLSRSSGVRLDVARALEVFAELLAREGDAHGAVKLAGTAAALRGRRPTGKGARLERALAPARRELGDPLAARLWAEGRSMSQDEAVAYALNHPAPYRHPHTHPPKPTQPPAHTAPSVGAGSAYYEVRAAHAAPSDGSTSAERATSPAHTAPTNGAEHPDSAVRVAHAAASDSSTSAERADSPAGAMPSNGAEQTDRAVPAAHMASSGSSALVERAAPPAGVVSSGGVEHPDRVVSAARVVPSGRVEWESSGGGEAADRAVPAVRGKAGGRGGAGRVAPVGRGVRSGHGRGDGPVRAGRAAGGLAVAGPVVELTAREREIARLVARGLSNRGIAGELVISPATVARHVTNILTKLGFGSRAQVAVWAVGNLPGER